MCLYVHLMWIYVQQYIYFTWTFTYILNMIAFYVTCILMRMHVCLCTHVRIHCLCGHACVRRMQILLFYLFLQPMSTTIYVYPSAWNTRMEMWHTICGDYNINLLKMNGETHFPEFFDTMLGHSFYPKITLLTRLNRSSGATLIDNIYCKLSSQTVTSSAGIILDELSDHYPYFLRIDNLNTKLSKPPLRVKQKWIILEQWKT